MDFRSAAVNALWCTASFRAWRQYQLAIRRPAEAQTRLLGRYVTANRNTVFGREHGFARIRSVEDYQARVPLRTYDDLEPFIHAAGRGVPRVLTEAPVERLVPTGGSTAAVKLIPFTAALRHEFSRAIDAWLVDLFLQHPDLLGGPAYWSITPLVPRPASTSSAAVPVGFEDDTMYLGRARQTLAKAVMAVPSEVAGLRDATTFRYATVLFLLRARNLRLISVWHPSFLGGLLDILEDHRDRLLRDIAAGTFNPPTSVAPVALVRLVSLLPPDAKRAAALRETSELRTIWPKLSLISCWADSAAAGPAHQLAARAGGISVQPKGLLATEGAITIPFGGRRPLAVRSHFLEFVDRSGRIRLAHQLERGEQYTVVISTGGGLYRYKLGDRVSVDAFLDATPSLRFLGREDGVSDWFGEKLTDAFVASVVRTLFRKGPAPRFALLAPEQTANGVSYTLFVDATSDEQSDLDVRLEVALRKNPQYAWCVDVGQLRPARVVHVDRGAEQIYIEACARRGQRLGDIKPVALRADAGWESILPCRHFTAEGSRC
jgi:hypothetical protein